jgi:crotonobetainyl-CoA:carnitine CoA-transferase CaiB-like acyl-CoA transferase
VSPNEQHNRSLALRRFKVLDLSRVRAGPTCARLLSDFGADVIRIEPPAGIDPNEKMFAAKRQGGDFQNLNRNKRGLSLNLKRPEAREVLARLVKSADVVLENWRPDVKKRLGLDYAALREINPRIILASISGFGQDGPYASRPGFDQVVQGMGGLMSITGVEGGGPVRAGIAVADSSTGIYLAFGILAALLEREVSGQGQWVHASLLHAQIAMLDFQAARFLVDGEVPRQEGNNHPGAAPMGLFHAADGVMNVAVSGEGQWQNFCRAMGREDWLQRPDLKTNADRIRNRKVLNAEIEELLGSEPVAHWVEKLNANNVPSGPVYTIPQMFDDPQVKHLDVSTTVHTRAGRALPVITQPVHLVRTPAKVLSAAPEIGEHTDAVLKECGYTESEIRALRECGAV